MMRPPIRWPRLRATVLGHPARFAAVVAVAAMALAACGSQDPVVVTVTGNADSTAVTAPSLPAAPETTTSTSTDVESVDVSAEETSTSTSTSESSSADAIRVSATPSFGSKNVAPNDPVSLMALHGDFTSVTMTGDDGSSISGEIADGNKAWKATDTLKYGVTYTLSGDVAAADGSSKAFDKKISTVAPDETILAAIQVPESATVGVATPVILTFFKPVENKSEIQKRLHVTVNGGDEIEGAWVWMQDEDVTGDGTAWSRVHFRTKDYWPAGTKVHVEADLYGIDYSTGWGREKVTRDFEIGPNLVVKADVDSHRLLVLKDGAVVKNYPVSYGVPKADDEGRTTVSGIHVITDKKPGEFTMSNPKYGYEDVKEYWGVRINNNGEFIHVNKKTEASGQLGQANVSHGCVNMSMTDGKQFFDTVYYGVPVEVEGTGVEMTERDYIWDWSKSWDEWYALSQRTS